MARRRYPLGWLICGLWLWAGCGHEAPQPPALPALVTAPPSVEAPKPAVAPPSNGLLVSPSAIILDPSDPGFQLLASIKGRHSGRRDVTAAVAWTAEPSGVVVVDPQGYVKSLAPGRATLHASFEGSKSSLPVEVVGGQPSWNFGVDIVPIFTRSGCNTGSCHGRADGQNGFHLSLFGYDPQADYQAITHDAAGRRLSRIDPARSLLLQKATGRIPHGGGPRILPGSQAEKTLLAWLSSGAPETSGKIHGPLTALAVEPSDVRLDEPGPQQLRVLAHFADGHARDVTRLANYRVGDEFTLSITPQGQAKLLRRAEADLVVRFLSQVVSTRLATIVNPDLAFDFDKLPRRNFIDAELFKRLASLKVPPSPTASDPVFLRRVSLDLTGEQPQPEQVRQFLNDTDPDKRAKLVDRLLQSREFLLFWKIKFGDLLQISSVRFGNGASYYHTWLEERLAANTPWDQVVRTLMTALGNPMTPGGGPVNYALDGVDPTSAAEQTAQRFLALRMRCAQCHDHPFDVWTQDDYFGLAAFFAKVQRGAPGAMQGRTEIKVDPKGAIEHLRTKKPSIARLLDGKPLDLKPEDDPRKALADWMTAPGNPYFARAAANWVWAQFFGKGIADPPDDLSRSNPPVHPELLDALARHFVDHKFDLRDLIRTIAVSEAYGLSSGALPGNEKDTRLFSHQIPRPLTAHQMADALAQATDVPNRFPQRPAGTRSIEVADPSTASNILETFGRCARNVGCASVATPPLSLRQSLLLIGGDVIESKVTSLNGYLANLLTLNPEPDEIVDNLYLRVVCRFPTPEEQSRWAAELKQAKSLREASEDLFWALLNSREFSFNH